MTAKKQTTSPPASPATDPAVGPFPVIRYGAMLVAAVAVLAAGVWTLLVYALGLPQMAPLNVIGAVTCGVAGLLGFGPVWLMSRKAGIQGAAFGFLVGILIRMAICAAVVILADKQGYENAKLLGYWVAGWYMAVLAMEVKLLSSYLRSAPVAPAPATDDTADDQPADPKENA